MDLSVCSKLWMNSCMPYKLRSTGFFFIDVQRDGAFPLGRGKNKLGLMINNRL